MISLQEIKSLFSELGQTFTFTQRQTANYTKYIRYVVFAGLFLVTILAGFGLYKWYVIHRERAVQQLFSEYLLEYQKAVKTNKKEDWEHVENLFKMGYDRNLRSNLGPYFLAFQAEAILRQARQDEAIATMEQMMQTLPNSSPFLNLYQAKCALMMLDSTQEDMHKKGLEVLEALVKDESNIFRDFAQYYLGLYYWSTGDAQAAGDVWQELVQAQQIDQVSPSPWAQQAETRLEQLG